MHPLTLYVQKELKQTYRTSNSLIQFRSYSNLRIMYVIPAAILDAIFDFFYCKRYENLFFIRSLTLLVQKQLKQTYRTSNQLIQFRSYNDLRTMYVIPVAILNAIFDFYNQRYENLIFYTSIDFISTKATDIDIQNIKFTHVVQELR